MKSESNNLQEFGLKKKLRNYWKLLIMSLVFSYIFGFGGYTYQTPDYIKHNLIIKDLCLKPWPVTYINNEQKTDFLCYNLAYYLPFTVVSNLVGNYSFYWPLIRIFSFIWSWFGLFLVYCWIYKFIKRKVILSVLVFTFLGNPEILGIFISRIYNLDLNYFIDVSDQVVKINKYVLLFPNNINHMFWAPQHVIGGYLATALFFDSMNKENVNNIIFIHALTIFWSVFIFIGIIPFTLYVLFKRFNYRIMTFQNIIGAGFITILFLFYYEAHYPMEYFDFLFSGPFKFKHIINFLYFIFFEIWLIGIFLYYYKNNIHFVRKHLNFVFYLLCFLSLTCMFIIGRCNDLVMRASIPAMFIVSICVVHLVLELPNIKRDVHFYVFIFILGIGFILPVKEILKASYYFSIQMDETEQPISILGNNNYHANQIEEYYLEKINFVADYDVSHQYLGRENSVFYKYILKNN